MAIVYQHIRKDTNQVFYIGIGNDSKRAYSIKDRNRYWKNIVSKVGYHIDIIENDLTWEAACIKEKELINFYGRFDLGKGNLVNMTNGGDGIFGLIFSEESKRKISEGNKNKIMSQEAKIKIGLAQKGNKHCLGKHRSEEAKIKIGLAQKGMKRSEETKRKMREAWKKRKIK